MKTSDIQIWNYGNYSSENYGSSRAVRIGQLTLYFSYNTIIAFSDGATRHIRVNSWSTTTGKHLNEIDKNKKIRENPEVFGANLEKCLNKYMLIKK